jgi:hypothetical protein
MFENLTNQSSKIFYKGKMNEKNFSSAFELNPGTGSKTKKNKNRWDLVRAQYYSLFQNKIFHWVTNQSFETFVDDRKDYNVHFL